MMFGCSLRKSASKNQKVYNTPLRLAIKKNACDIFEYLLSKEADINETDDVLGLFGINSVNTSYIIYGVHQF